ncbi:MAG: type II toxin-antitoxin system RelE/ParE family toxin [Desulfomicrobium sp.]|uniref:type II toxin-antitoxin system RelE/ParE family toxin n=1 Tax=Hoeflea sp. TaxID=1940281 RepID=UPI0025B84324|nr:type II toxin-antitoxin system RelE/ParE family toxin [Hoeflea sp.]MBU4529358.1 type II toxin-antitoxin system RelE/ParE family toxin [Alphaproteobacteria bacterium]MBV1712674.1 type II toxin-antitoxin system RelE/ParE family toxin [Desulfomicrobium sp.]MCA0343681.1 type II toxin-antitoxin system RelE/ParE family toxin [Pseudomonadota bacterium]MDI6836665.1 type II toxin-antitoxin system RelE/ParE family toxin [Rhizobiaceae bacterium]MBU4545029.1 type II toxin-antitoxin system RelE/ParE fam
MKLTWSAYALSDRDAIFTYIEADNPAAAALIDERIVAAVRRLLDFPVSGRAGRIAGTRELVINGTPYVAAYAITETTVRILRVLHGAQEWPEYLPVS